MQITNVTSKNGKNHITVRELPEWVVIEFPDNLSISVKGTNITIKNKK